VATCASCEGAAEGPEMATGGINWSSCLRDGCRTEAASLLREFVPRTADSGAPVLGEGFSAGRSGGVYGAEVVSVAEAVLSVVETPGIGPGFARQI
jgi:hypothetical protein